MNCNGVILEEIKKNEKKIIYKIDYKKNNEFEKIDDDNIDEFFKTIVNHCLNDFTYELKFDDGYNETEENDVMKTFFETFFDEIEESKKNIEIIKETFEEYKNLKNIKI